MERTVKATDNGFVVWSRFDYDFDMRVCTSKLLQVAIDVGASVGRGRPFVAVLEDELATLGNKVDVAVGGP